VGPMGAANAGHLAAAILALSDEPLRARLQAKRARQTEEVLAKSKDLPAKLRELLKS
jgi:phosphoribosylcarboxyaminoimidazole (NCAIR) mutase